MLFRALTDRLLGTNESQIPDGPVVSSYSRISFDKYPKLLDIIVKFLKAGHEFLSTGKDVAIAGREQQRTTESVFPALYILQKALPPQKDLQKIKELVLSLTASPQWVVRDMAARTYAALVASTGATHTVQSILKPPFIDQNALHGRLLSVKYTIRTRLHFASTASRYADDFTVLENASHSRTSEVGHLLTIIEERLLELYQDNPCSITKATYVDIIALFFPFQSLERLRDRFTEDLKDYQDRAKDSLLRRSIEDFLKMYSYNQASFLSTRTGTSVGRVSPNPHLTLRDGVSQPKAAPMSEAQSFLRISLERFGSLESQLLLTSDPSKQVALLGSLSKLLYRIQGSCGDTSPLEIILPKLDLGFLNDSVADPSSEESVLHLYSLYLDAEILKVSTGNSTRHLTVALHRLRNAVDDNQPPSTRLAVAKTLSLLRLSWTYPHQSLFSLKLHLLVQEILADDDEEPRMLAALSIAHILSAESNSRGVSHKAPLVAKEQHGQYLIRTYGQGETRFSLLFYLVAKLTGANTDLAINHLLLQLPSVQSLLGQTLRRRLALFDQEDQNLYRDQTFEHAYFADKIGVLASKIWKQGRIPRMLVECLSTWVMEGLDSLTSHLEHHGSGGRLSPEGPLGWTYNKDAFALAYSVISAARLLLIWRAKYRKGPVKASLIKKALFRCLIAAERNNANPHLTSFVRTTVEEGCKLTFAILNRKTKEVLGKELVEFA